MIKGIQPLSDLAAHKTGSIKSKSTAQTLKNSSSPQSVLPRSPAAAAPSDKLSSSIVSFARFFSLPLKPSLLADIRRSVFQLPLTSAFQDASADVKNTAGVKNAAAFQNDQIVKALADIKTVNDVKMREADSVLTARALAAAAAESKGIELNPKGLESYAYALDPYSRRQDGERKKHDKEQNQQETELNIKKVSDINIDKENEKTAERDKFMLTAENFKNLFLEDARQNPAAEILNTLPGKNGQRWIVLPFDFSEGEREYRVSMRILLSNDKMSDNAACMALDIFSYNRETEDEKSRFLFLFESANDKPARISVYLPKDFLSSQNKNKIPENDLSKYKKELSQSFNIPPERINIKFYDEPFPFESGFGNDSIISVNEEA